MKSNPDPAFSHAPWGADSALHYFVIEPFQRLLFMPDPYALIALIAAVVANFWPGDPVWLILVGPPSSGKTELLIPLIAIPRSVTLNGLPFNMHLCAQLSVPGLLSATPAKERSKKATGGLLRKVGDFGFLIAKDFTSNLNQHRSLNDLLAAMRETYDGCWGRDVGGEGGMTISWSGKLAFIAGCTDAIDRAHGTVSAMGERFLFARMPLSDPKLASGDTAKPANEGHLKTGQWSGQDRISYSWFRSSRQGKSSPPSTKLNYTVKT